MGVVILVTLTPKMHHVKRGPLPTDEKKYVYKIESYFEFEEILSSMIKCFFYGDMSQRSSNIRPSINLIRKNIGSTESFSRTQNAEKHDKSIDSEHMPRNDTIIKCVKCV